jgi:hypothetical protein
MQGETRLRTVVKSALYRLFVLFTTVCLMWWEGKTIAESWTSILVINIVWTFSYYTYDRLWNMISWGRK